VSSELYESVADLLPVGVLVIGGQGRLLEANQPGLDFLGLDHGAFEQPLFGALLGSEALRDALSECRDEVRRFEVSEAGRDLLAETRPFPDREDGATLLVLRETSTTTTAAAQKRNFIFDLLHKVRTPLTTIFSVLSMASSDRMDPRLVDTKALLSMGAREAERLTVFLSRLRDLFLVETGTLDAELRVEPFTVAVAMGQVAADLREKVTGKRQTLVENYPDEDLKALVDRAVLGRALELVALNAHQYTPERGTIRMGAERRNGSICIRISDDGPGIPEEELPRVFERFYRGTTAVSADVEGEGLGLYLARHLLQALGATIHLDSRSGEGTRVEIQLPAAEDHP
jgi:two-component system phosphate regulon sensor histidine kinase PhoR